jgi:hypothetical protein
VATITDDDPTPRLVISNATIVEGNSGTKNLYFLVSLSAASGRTVTVQYATADDTAIAGGDYTSRAGTLTFTPGAITQSVTIVVSGDALVEGTERFLLNLTAAVNATIDDPQAAGVILDDDEAGPGGASAAHASDTALAGAKRLARHSMRRRKLGL